MSAVSTSRPKKQDPLSKKTPSNPKYAHIRSTLDTGCSITKLQEKIEDLSKYYKHRKDEIFKRMKITTFAQLLVQVADIDREANSPNYNGQNTDRPDTADMEIQRIQGRDNSPRKTDRDGGGGDTRRETRSKLEQVISGVGEIDVDKPPTIGTKDLHTCPYLLLDMRDCDCYKQCHLITALSYPKSQLSKATNYESKEMLQYKNKEGRIIVIYDDDESIAPKCAETLVQRGYDNVFLLSGGMRVAYKVFPEGLFTGTPSEKVTEGKKLDCGPACKSNFDEEDLNHLHLYLDNALGDHSVGSRLSNASTSSSRLSGASKMSKAKAPCGPRPAFKC